MTAARRRCGLRFIPARFRFARSSLGSCPTIVALTSPPQKSVISPLPLVGRNDRFWVGVVNLAGHCVIYIRVAKYISMPTQERAPSRTLAFQKMPKSYISLQEYSISPCRHDRHFSCVLKIIFSLEVFGMPLAKTCAACAAVLWSFENQLRDHSCNR